MTRGSTGPVFTVGHSTRPVGIFAELLVAHGVTRLLDIRTVPRSRTNPQFDLATLPVALAAAGIGHAHVPALGGLRRPLADSPNAGWRNLSFRGYADHMATPAFAAAIDEVVEVSQRERLALMCAEAVPWRCHRSLVADALLVRGVAVEELVGPVRRRPHVLTPFARVDGLRLTYPALG